MPAQFEPQTAAQYGRSLGIHPCPQCGDCLLAPVGSEHVSEHRVRHVWSCERCGHRFETSVHFPKH